MGCFGFLGGCFGSFRVVLVVFRLFWLVLGQFLALVMGCFGLFWVVLACLDSFWVVFPRFGLFRIIFGQFSYPFGSLWHFLDRFWLV